MHNTMVAGRKTVVSQHSGWSLGTRLAKLDTICALVRCTWKLKGVYEMCTDVTMYNLVITWIVGIAMDSI